MRKLVVLNILFTMLIFANYTKSGNIVKDSETKLEWQDTRDQVMKKFTWLEAIGYCENLELDGYSDWRLPNIVELSSIIDDSKTQALLPNEFENNRAGEYWSSTTKAGANQNAWRVWFDNGFLFFKDKKEKLFVRCVRSGK